MSTQYNEIFSAYSALYPPGGETVSDFPLAPIEAANLHTALNSPTVSIKGKRVLDLASGNGHYASKFLHWGARSVVGMDISEGMLGLAREDAKKRGLPEDKLKFVVGDACSEDLSIDGGDFDIVTGCWLLNYASDIPTMAKMWRFIGRHLKKDGVFVGLTVPPLLTQREDEGTFLHWAYSKEGVWGRHGNGGEVLERLRDGEAYATRCILGTSAQQETASFETFHPSYKVFNESCRISEMFDGQEWQDFVIPQEAKKGRPTGYWNELALWPHCRVCIARRV